MTDDELAGTAQAAALLIKRRSIRASLSDWARRFGSQLFADDPVARDNEGVAVRCYLDADPRRLEQNGMRETGDSAAPTMKHPSENQPQEVLAGLIERVT
jgi:hypothetical protein